MKFIVALFSLVFFCAAFLVILFLLPLLQMYRTVKSTDKPATSSGKPY
jgi:predicted exporter